MKAILHSQYGPPNKLKIIEQPTPEPGKDELLIEVHTATVNRTDCANLLAKPAIMRLFIGLFKPKKTTTGTDFAGVVIKKGAEANRFNQGDRIFGFEDSGLLSHATHLIIHQDKSMALIPEGVSYEEACASCEGPHYAFNAIKKMDVVPGHRVLVHGATGAIGSAGLQLLKNFGVEVTATCNTSNIHLIQNLGADRVIDYTKEDFTKIEGGFNFVFDAVGKSTFGTVKHLLKPGGAYISTELGPNMQNVWFALFPFLTGNKKVLFPYPSQIQRSIDLMRELLELKTYKPVIDKVYPLNEVPQAFEYVLTGQKTGNVVIRMVEKIQE